MLRSPGSRGAPVLPGEGRDLPAHPPPSGRAQGCRSAPQEGENKAQRIKKRTEKAPDLPGAGHIPQPGSKGREVSPCPVLCLSPQAPGHRPARVSPVPVPAPSRQVGQSPRGRTCCPRARAEPQPRARNRSGREGTRRIIGPVSRHSIHSPPWSRIPR